ncbi:MAG: 3-oxoadipate enol-lactonase [Sphingobium sp.]|jgi:3-oxoadipate enol-lactonase|nr:MAG: 3-oxoadipate enol-lactonase [Sphingobium sp.]
MTVATFTTGDGCPIAYRFDGPADAPVLLLSNSLGTTMAMWEPQMAAFTSRFRVLRYDSRGHGASAVPAGAYSMDRLGRDAVELLDGLGLDRVDFCGLSKGGMVGQWLGIRAGDRVRRLILANTSSFMGPARAWDDRIGLVLSEGMAPLAQASVARWFTQAFQDNAPDAITPISAMLGSIDPIGYAGCCAAIRDMDMRRVVTLVERPVLVIGGALDPSTPPPHSEALVRAISGSELTMLDAAHLSNVEQPDVFAKACLDFLGKA